MSARLSGGETIIRTLEAHGVDTVFGIPGGHNLAIYDALSRGTRIRHIMGRHEQGVGFMADGYARASGRIGVAIVTSGPAVANLACSLGGATTDTSPVLVIASTVRRELVGRNRGALHDCGEAIEVVRHLCRHVRRAMSVAEVPVMIADLIHKLNTGRAGGAFIEIPCDVLGAEAEVAIHGPLAAANLQPDPGLVAQAVDLLHTARRPVIWVGTGAVISNAGAEVAALAERLGAMVVPTVLGQGILSADHPYVVAPDGAAWSQVNDVIADADVVLAVGTMFKQENTVDWKTTLGDTLIHIDIDSEEIGRSYKPTVGIVADAKTALSLILEHLPIGRAADPSWLASGKQAEADRLHGRREQSPGDMAVLDALRAAVPRNGIITCDRCNLGYWAYKCLPVYEPRTFFYPMGYGGLGGALPQAFGAKIACAEKAVVCVIGDGGFQFTATELAVAVQEEIPVTIVLCNNNAYGAIRANQDRNFAGRRFASDLRNPDFQTLSAAYGIPSLRVDNVKDFHRSLADRIASGNLSLIELAIDISDP